VKEWATKDPLSYPVLIDTMHIVADLYGIVNVPASLWIDENNKIVRPADSTPASDMWRSFSGVDSAVHHELLRRWVRNNELTMDADEVRSFQVLPTSEVQQARLHRRIAVSLRESGDESGALEHMDKAEQLAPHDWTIRRGNMPLRGVDPFGEKFMEFVGEWSAAGSPGFKLGTGRETK
jgi:hypothetical protein